MRDIKFRGKEVDTCKWVYGGLFKEFDIGRLHKFEYKGKDKNGKNKYKIRYTPMFMVNCYVDETIVEN